MTEAKIKTYVDEVFNETELLATPVEVVSMASYFGFPVYEIEMDNNTSGIIMIDEKPIKGFNTNKLIVVNSIDSPTRKRFTIAHELGHYILQDRPKKCYAHRDSKDNYSPEEKDANSFASALLMPEEDITKFANSFRNTTDDPLGFALIGKAARRYNVSESAVEVRLKKLKLI